MPQDQSGDIEAKLWDAKQSDEVTYAPQTIVKVVGMFIIIAGAPS